jgi:DNA-binding response OmpR family regulator
MTTDKKDFTNRLADLRHDLRTPAGHVMGYAEIIEEEFEGEDHPEILSNLSSLKKQGELLLELIDEYLGARTKDISEVLSRGASENLARPLVTIEDSCNTLRPLLEKTGGADDLEKVEKAALHLAELIEGIPQALSGPEMPVTEEPELESTQEIPSPVVSVLGEGGVILIVDDNEANRDLLGRKLQAQGYTPVVVEGGEAALKYLESEEVDIILLDMIMPGMSGAEVLRSLKSSAATKNIPVVMLSALDDMEKVVACISMGAEDYLFKPANPVLLKARISATLEKNRLRRQLAPRLRVFISSPSDVEAERARAKRVIDRLNEELAGKVYMLPVLWEDEPLRASETAQTQIVAPRDTDIYIGIFWARMGTMLPEDICRPDGTRYGSGTEFEFEDALAGHEEKKRPEILVYRRTSQPVVALDDRSRVLDRLDQKEKLEQFIQRWFSTEDGLSIARVYHAFESTDEFEDVLERHLRKLAVQIIEERES